MRTFYFLSGLGFCSQHWFIFFALKDTWLFHLKVASGSGIDDMGTAFEKHIFELIAQDCDPGNTTCTCSTCTCTLCTSCRISRVRSGPFWKFLMEKKLSQTSNNSPSQNIRIKKPWSRLKNKLGCASFVNPLLGVGKSWLSSKCLLFDILRLTTTLIGENI